MPLFMATLCSQALQHKNICARSLNDSFNLPQGPSFPRSHRNSVWAWAVISFLGLQLWMTLLQMTDHIPLFCFKTEENSIIHVCLLSYMKRLVWSYTPLVFLKIIMNAGSFSLTCCVCYGCGVVFVWVYNAQDLC